MESLYTTYRPQTFADVAGQRPVVGALERAVLNESVGHAYLFCGPRGTGKTTMARILAKALLCEAGPGVLPDGTCEQCEAIALGVHPDVLEIDAASRTSVNDVREEIISKVDFAPVLGRYKVYVIDEVHMLSVAAFNALLKTLEEPPSHVVFILCTTDPQKVPATILSRVQRFNFLPLTDSDMLGRLNYICEHEGYHAEPEALELIVRHAHGGMRDAISTLEQLAIFGEGTINQTLARDLLGATSEATLKACMEALAAKDGAALFTLVAQVVGEGQDLRQFAGEVLRRVRDLYVVFCAGVIPELLGASQAEAEELIRESQLFGSAERISRVMSELDDLGWKLRDASNARLELEVALTKLVRPETDLTLEALAERVAQLEAAETSGAMPRLAGEGTAHAGEPTGEVETPKLERPSAESSRNAQVGSNEPPASFQAQNASSWGSRAGSDTSEPLRDRPKPAAMTAPATASGSFDAPSHSAATEPVSKAASAPAPHQGPADVAPSNPSHSPDPMPSGIPHNPASSSPAVPAAPSTPKAPVPRTSFQPSSSPAQPSSAPAKASEPAAAPSAAAGSRPPAKGPELTALWDEVLAGLPPVRGALLAGSTVVEDDGHKITVAVDASPLTQGMLGRTDVVAEIEQALKPVFGTRRFVPRYDDEPHGPSAAGSSMQASPWGAPAPAPTSGFSPVPSAFGERSQRPGSGFSPAMSAFGERSQNGPSSAAPMASGSVAAVDVPPWEDAPAPSVSFSSSPGSAPAPAVSSPRSGPTPTFSPSSAPAPAGSSVRSRSAYRPQMSASMAPAASTTATAVKVAPWEESLTLAPTPSPSRRPASAPPGSQASASTAMTSASPAASTQPWQPAASAALAQPPSSGQPAPATPDAQAPSAPAIEAPPQFSEALSQLASVFGEVQVLSVEGPGAAEPLSSPEGPAY